MIRVMVDGQDFPADIGEVKTMGDLIELVKATIDPDSIVTSMLLEGKPLLDSDWRTPLSANTGSLLEITTGGKEAYLADRLASAEDYLSRIIDEFLEAGSLYRSSAEGEGNAKLGTAVDDLLAFVNWYLSLLSIKAEEKESQIIEFDQHIRSLQAICQELLQQQMFQSWQVLGETLENKLGPGLCELKSFCVRNAGLISGGQESVS